MAGRPQTGTLTARLPVCLWLSGGDVLIWQPVPLRRARFPFPPGRGLTVNLSLRDFWDASQISRPESAAFGKVLHLLQHGRLSIQCPAS